MLNQKELKLAETITENILVLKKIFELDETIVFRELESCGLKAIKFCLVYIDGMVKKEVLNRDVLNPLMDFVLVEQLSNKDLLKTLSNKVIQCSELTVSNNLEEISSSIISGKSVLLIDGIASSLILDTPGWRTRALSEPKSEEVVKGPREGFNESLTINLSLIRRRIKNTNLKFIFKKLGNKTKTQICICYIKEIAQDTILTELIKRIDSINIDSVLESGYIEELVNDAPLSPFKTVGSTERPDTAAAKLLEGRIAIICDGTPTVLTVPYIFIESFQTNEDYYNNYIFSSINRILRLIGFFLTTSVPAIYISIVNFHQELIQTPLLLSISNSRQGVPFPTIVELIVMLLVFEILREAGTRLPKSIGQAVGIVGALVLGDAAVNARLISAPIVIITAITGISSFLIPQLVGVIIIRIIFLIMSSLLGLYGYVYGIMGLFIYLASLRSFGVPYMLNFGTGALSFQEIKDTAIRVPWWLMNKRPRLISKEQFRQSNRNKK